MGQPEMESRVQQRSGQLPHAREATLEEAPGLGQVLSLSRSAPQKILSSGFVAWRCGAQWTRRAPTTFRLLHR